MSDQQTSVEQTQGSPKAAGGLRQKIFNIIGWAAFLLLAPLVLKMLNLPQLQNFMIERLGGWGSPIALIGFFYSLLFLRVFFGSDQRYTPVLIGFTVSFLYFCNSLDISFMHWLYELAHKIPALSYNAMSFIAGILVIFLSNAMSGARRAKWPLDVLVLVVLPAGALIAAGILLPGPLGL
ncbi:MAG: hypothetical protein E4H20_05115 [Spirochaetales bacterium]|nr:MAG: hypothetical protein E4H20_05115 [Spirochaetales bacterium]